MEFEKCAIRVFTDPVTYRCLQLCQDVWPSDKQLVEYPCHVGNAVLEITSDNQTISGQFNYCPDIVSEQLRMLESNLTKSMAFHYLFNQCYHSLWDT